MADIRVYGLDEQASYSKEIFLVVDDDTFTQAKKMAVGTLYPKVDQLSSASSINEDTWVLRINNGSGAETKITLADFFDLRYKLIKDLNSLSDAHKSNDLVRIYDASADIEKKISLNNLIDPFIKQEYTLEPGYTSSGETLCNVKTSRVGKLVTIHIEQLRDTGGGDETVCIDTDGTELYLWPDAKPVKKIHHFQVNWNKESEGDPIQFNRVQVLTNGAIVIRSRNTFQAYGFSYTTL